MSAQEQMVLDLVVRAVTNYWPIVLLLVAGAIGICKAAFGTAHYKAM